VFPVRYGLDFDIPEDFILHSHCSKNLKSYIDTCTLQLIPLVTYHQNVVVPVGLAYQCFRETMLT
jgi:hypothetical protein